MLFFLIYLQPTSQQKEIKLSKSVLRSTFFFSICHVELSTLTKVVYHYCYCESLAGGVHLLSVALRNISLLQQKNRKQSGSHCYNVVQVIG